MVNKLKGYLTLIARVNPPGKNFTLNAKDVAILEDLIDTFRLDQASVQANAMQHVLTIASNNSRKPIPHNGKEYWPDANGWYEIACLTYAGSYTFGRYQKCVAANNYVVFQSFNLQYTEEAELMQEGDYFDDYELSDFQYFKPFSEPLPAGPVEGG